MQARGEEGGSMMSKEIHSEEQFINGNTAATEGAIAAGCRFYAGYPITPSSEIMEHMARRLPEVGGVFIQMEDEIASMAAILGASCAGVKSMTATSGPGFSLMMENIGLSAMTETPCVVVNIMRGGPSTGLPTLVGQADVMQARWGSHGDYSIIAYTPSSPQEMFDHTIKAFNMSEKYRVPVIVLGDEVVGHMTEKVIIPDKVETVSRKKPRRTGEKFQPFKADKSLVPPMANAGDGFHIHVTGLTHDERGYPVITGEAQEKLVRRLVDKIRKNSDDIIEYQEIGVENADVVIVAYGITARVASRAIELAKEEGMNAGMFRLVAVWPFPEGRIRKLASQIKGFVVPEINYGQICYEVERCACGQCETVPVSRMGGDIHTPEEILEKMREVAGK